MTSTPPTWYQMIHALELMTQEERKAAMPATLSTDELVARFPELAAVKACDFAIEGPHGTIPCRSYRLPGDGTRACLVWAHGGGFVAGDLDMAEAHWVGLMIAARGVNVMSIDYHKCLDGARFPLPSDDVLAAWLWAVTNAAWLGTTAQNIHLGGASAGANLVAGVTKRLRDGAGLMPKSTILAYPLVHQELPPASAELAARLATESTAFTAEAVQQINMHYAGTREALDDPYAFASNGDISGQPPFFILNSEADSLRSSGEAYAAQLEAAGVTVVATYEPGTSHGHLNEPALPAAATSIQRIFGWIDTYR